MHQRYQMVAINAPVLPDDHKLPCYVGDMFEVADDDRFEAHSLHHTTSYRVRVGYLRVDRAC